MMQLYRIDGWENYGVMFSFMLYIPTPFPFKWERWIKIPDKNPIYFRG